MSQDWYDSRLTLSASGLREIDKHAVGIGGEMLAKATALEVFLDHFAMHAHRKLARRGLR